MRSIRLVAVILAVLVGFTSCSRDPAVVRKRYLESGNKYFDKGRYKEASIQYRNALKRDPRYGAAYYKLALVNLKVGEAIAAVSPLRRAVELIPPDQPDHWDAVSKLSDIYLAFSISRGEKLNVKDVETLIDDLLKHDSNSFDGHRLSGDLNYSRATDAYRNKQPDEGLVFLDKATAEYRRADSVKPGQQGVLMQLARARAAKTDFAEAEAIYRRVIDKDKTFQSAYTELYRLFMYQNKPGDAEQVLRLAFENNPKQFEYLTLLAMHYYGLQRRDAMAGMLHKIKSHADRKSTR